VPSRVNVKLMFTAAASTSHEGNIASNLGYVPAQRARYSERLAHVMRPLRHKVTRLRERVS